MERRLRISSAHTSPVSVLAYHPVRRELITGHEDGTLKFWEVDTGHHVASLTHHKGWITDLFYWLEGKLLFSSSVDGTVVQLSSANHIHDTITLGEPIYSLLWASRKSQLIIGTERGLGVLKDSGKLAANGLPLLRHRATRIPSHTDIVRCLASSGSKVYSAGYDRKLVIYEMASLSGDKDLPLKTVLVNRAAHEAGITCLQMAKDTDGSTWMVTGSFDKRVKIWTSDGKLIHTIQCSDAVTGLCYVLHTRVLWIAAGSPLPLLYDPKSGDNVTEYIPVLGTAALSGHNYRENVVQLLTYVPETSEVIGSTKLKEIVCWKYNPTCSMCCYRSPSEMHVETLTYTLKVPILIFSGSFNGEMMKWEQQQLNPFLYSQDSLAYQSTLIKHLSSDDSKNTSVETEKRREAVEMNGHQRNVKKETGRRKGSRKVGDTAQDEKKDTVEPDVLKAEHRGFVRSLFVECLDLLVASALDGYIFVWGYDQQTVQVLERMQETSLSETTLPEGGSSHQQEENEHEPHSSGSKEESSSVTSRVAGFTCLHVLSEHTGCVQGLAAVERWREDASYLISGGWDLALCVWDLSSGRMVVCIAESLPSGHTLHPNLIITDLAYSAERNMFAYATSDSVVYLRQFGLTSGDLVLLGSLQGHHSEVTQVRWSAATSNWVTGSGDCTVRLWSADGSECEQSVLVGDPVSFLCIDQTSGCVIVAVQNTLKIYNRSLELLQVSKGHTDVIRSIIHIPDRNQYVSASWDGTVRIWRSCQPK